MAVIKRDVIIDPRFATPPGVVDVRNQNKEDVSFAYDESTAADEGSIIDSSEYLVPLITNFTIVEQMIRMTSDGRSVVDVVIDFPDLDGVSDLNVRIAKE